MIYSGDNFDAFGWAVLMAGGSLSNVQNLDQSISNAISTLKPIISNDKKQQYGLENAGKTYLFYNASAEAISLDLSKTAGKFMVKILNSKTGAIIKEEKINGNAMAKINKVGTGDEVVMINKI